MDAPVVRSALRNDGPIRPDVPASKDPVLRRRTHYSTPGMPGWPAGRGPGGGQSNLPSAARIGRSLRLVAAHLRTLR